MELQQIGASVTTLQNVFMACCRVWLRVRVDIQTNLEKEQQRFGNIIDIGKGITFMFLF